MMTICAYEAAGRSQNAFYEGARKDLGVRSGGLTFRDGPWLSQNVLLPLPTVDDEIASPTTTA